MSIVLVVFFHASIVLQDDGLLPSSCWLLNEAAASIRMPLFFGVSGLLLAGKLTSTLGRLFRSRVLLLWYLYVLWTAVSALMVLDNVAAFRDLRGWHVFLYDPNPVLWFLWALGLFTILARLVPAWLRLPVIALALVAACAVPAASIGPVGDPHFKAIGYLPFYLAGAWYPRLLTRVAARPAILGMPAILTLLLCLWLARTHSGQMLTVLTSAAGLLGGIAASVGAVRLPVLGSLLQSLGRNTLAIYVAHTPMLSAGVLIAQYHDYTGAPGVRYWAAPAATLCAIMLSLALHRFALSAGADFLYALPTARTGREKHPNHGEANKPD